MATVKSGPYQVTIKWSAIYEWDCVIRPSQIGVPECVPEVFMSESQSVLGEDSGIKSHTSPPASVSTAWKGQAWDTPPTTRAGLPLCPLHYLLWVLKVLGCFSYFIFMGLTWFSQVLDTTWSWVVSFYELQLQKQFRIANMLTFIFNHQIKSRL